MKRRTGELQIFSLSFMDLLSCALGGILLLYLALITQTKSKLKGLEDAQSTLVGFGGELNNVVFVFDHSGSMSKNNYPQYVELLSKYIKNLPFKKYSIVMFGHRVSSLAPTLSGNSPKDRQQGVDFLAGFKADGKCTETLAALQAAFAFDGVDTIVIMTDGAPTKPYRPGDYSRTTAVSTNTVLAGVRQLNPNRDVTINTVAMGDYFRANNLGPFLKQLASENGGEFIGR